MNNDTLRKVQLLQKDMAYFVKKICEKHNIQYFLIAGTLLGAVRHKGFIPWDDDLDIGMLRKDFEKFIEIFDECSNQKYHLQTWDTEENFALPIAKIRLNNTLYVEKNSLDLNINQGIYIDILPFDNIPDSIFLQKKQDIKTYILKRLLLIKLNYTLWEDNESYKKKVYSVLKIFTNILSVNKLKVTLYKEMVKYNSIDTYKVVTFGGSYGYQKESICKSYFEEIDYFKFENIEFTSFSSYEKYLTHLYGDFTKLPPKEKRYNRHNILKVEF